MLPLLQKAFGYHAHLFPTANMTGRHLWTLTRPNWREDYPILPEPLHSFYRGTSGQGRTEVTTLPELETIPHAAVWDMRVAYAAACENLPAGEPVLKVEHRLFSREDRYVKGRYDVAFKIPQDWTHIGLFMVQRPKRNTGWFYPSDAGGVYRTWASNGECSLAIANGWKVEILGSITWANPKERQAPRPLDVWQARLLRIWQDGDEPIREAVRDIMLQTIGGFHAHRRRETITIADTEPVPAGVLPRWDRAAHTYTYDRWAPLPAKDVPYQHPEWSIEVWARIRTKLLSHKGVGALHVPREHVLGLRTDALYLACDPGWTDTGAIGSFRLKAERAGPLPAPHDAKALRAIAGGD